MANEVWRWQHDTRSEFEAAAATSDGSLVVAGWEESASGEDKDFVAIKLNSSDGSLLWKWKAGSGEKDEILGASAGSGGSVVLSGFTNGNWSGIHHGSRDYAAMKLDSDGEIVWRFQGGTASLDEFYAVAVGQDDSAFFGGHLDYEFFMVKVDGDGNVVWEWMGDLDAGAGSWFAVALVQEDDSVVMAGSTEGVWSGTNAGNLDFSAVKMDSDGQEIWRWQNGTEENDYIQTIVAAEDGSTILIGDTRGSFGNSNAGDADCVAVKLTVDGAELWRWQEGTSEEDVAWASAMEEDEFLVMVGWTGGNWGGDAGTSSLDFMAVKLDASDGNTEAWRWQDGTNGVDQIRAITSPLPSGSMALAGYTQVSLQSSSNNNSDDDDFDRGVVLMLRTSSDWTQEPTVAPAPSPTDPSDSSSLTVVIAVVATAVVLLALLALAFFRWKKTRASLRGTRHQASNNPDRVPEGGVDGGPDSAGTTTRGCFGADTEGEARLQASADVV